MLRGGRVPTIVLPTADGRDPTEALDARCAELGQAGGACARLEASGVVCFDRDPVALDDDDGEAWWERAHETLALAPLGGEDERRRFSAQHPVDPHEVRRLCASTLTRFRIAGRRGVWINQCAERRDGRAFAELARRGSRERWVGLRRDGALAVIRLRAPADVEASDVARLFATTPVGEWRAMQRRAATRGWALTDDGLFDGFPIASALRLPLARLDSALEF